MSFQFLVTWSFFVYLSTLYTWLFYTMLLLGLWNLPSTQLTILKSMQNFEELLGIRLAYFLKLKTFYWKFGNSKGMSILQIFNWDCMVWCYFIINSPHYSRLKQRAYSRSVVSCLNLIATLYTYLSKIGMFSIVGSSH